MLMHWSYCSFALSHWHILWSNSASSLTCQPRWPAPDLWGHSAETPSCSFQCQLTPDPAKSSCMASIFINPLHVKFSRGNNNIYFHFMSFICIDMTQVVEILPQVSQELTYRYSIIHCIWSISWVLMSWRRKEPEHRQPWYSLCWTELIWSPHVKG